MTESRLQSLVGRMVAEHSATAEAGDLLRRLEPLVEDLLALVEAGSDDLKEAADALDRRL